MKDVKRFLLYFALLIVLGLAAYFAAYLLTVKRVVLMESVTPERTHWTVISELGGNFSHNIFDPALSLDRHVFRRHYWSDWFEIRDAAGQTNILYFVDAKTK
jgi:hypothetical protein